MCGAKVPVDAMIIANHRAKNLGGLFSITLNNFYLQLSLFLLRAEEELKNQQVCNNVLQGRVKICVASPVRIRREYISTRVQKG